MNSWGSHTGLEEVYQLLELFVTSGCPHAGPGAVTCPQSSGNVALEEQTQIPAVFSNPEPALRLEEKSCQEPTLEKQEVKEIPIPVPCAQEKQQRQEIPVSIPEKQECKDTPVPIPVPDPIPSSQKKQEFQEISDPIPSSQEKQEFQEIPVPIPDQQQRSIPEKFPPLEQQLEQPGPWQK
ncbi:hypothetical protein EK904_009632 [Melospiza melodia maxima]|nr:hypothetical protein EK904_009632 [Melospiza melodia maxima]